LQNNQTTQDKIAEMIGVLLKGYVPEIDEDIFTKGIVNSLFVLTIISQIETTFSVVIEDEDLELENFSSIRRMSDFVLKKTGSE
jgi:acyl carrier protein